MTDKEQLVDAVTRRVLEVLTGGGDERCPDCAGGCAARCANRARDVVAAGASRISFNGRGADVPVELGDFIDHTLLRPDASEEEIVALCTEARQYTFASVCVNPTFAKLAARELAASPVVVCSVVGFPFGTHVPEIKALEAERAAAIAQEKPMANAGKIAMLTQLCGVGEGGATTLVTEVFHRSFKKCTTSMAS